MQVLFPQSTIVLKFFFSEVVLFTFHDLQSGLLRWLIMSIFSTSPWLLLSYVVDSVVDVEAVNDCGWGTVQVLEADLAILDEIDSGLDIDALRDVATAVVGLQKESNAVLMITHYQRLLEYIKPTYVHIMVSQGAK